MCSFRVVIALALAGVFASASNASAADTPATGGRIPTVTRLVKRFLELEGTLATNLRAGKTAAVATMLADDFELRVASMPGHPTPRDEWLRRAVEQPGPEVQIEQMAVHDYGAVAVVSFLQAAMAGQQRDAARDIATVDVWKRNGDAWILAVRYAGPAGAQDFVIPGASTDPPIPKRY